MNVQLVSVLIAEGGKLVSSLLATRPRHRQEQSFPEIVEVTPPETSQGTAEKAEEGTACLPCINSHFSVCSGLISDEALRMARRHGIGDEEIRRINKCLDQLNAMEREDLAIEKIKDLPPWEKEIAIYAQNESADIRHGLETLTSVDDLEKVAIRIKDSRIRIGSRWFKGKLARLTPEEKMRIQEKLDAQTQKELDDLKSMR